MAQKLKNFTKRFHNEPYPAIDPTQPQLSCKGKTVIITGANPEAIGGHAAIAFARAGASQIALIGQTPTTLEATKSRILEACPNSDINVLIAKADITSPESLGSAAHAIRATCGAWDVFVHAAAYIEPATTIRGADEDDWWQAFETNVRPLHFIARHFLIKCRPQAVLIVVGAAFAYQDTLVEKTSAYSASKLAAMRICDFISEENGNEDGLGLRVVNVHPGFVQTDRPNERSTEFIGNEDVEKATGEGQTSSPHLPAQFFVWCASDQAKFLKGRHVWANWDVEELITRREEIEANPGLLKISLEVG